jgi:hypothetical protein
VCIHIYRERERERERKRERARERERERASERERERERRNRREDLEVQRLQLVRHYYRPTSTTTSRVGVARKRVSIEAICGVQAVLQHNVGDSGTHSGTQRDGELVGAN